MLEHIRKNRGQAFILDKVLLGVKNETLAPIFFGRESPRVLCGERFYGRFSCVGLFLVETDRTIYTLGTSTRSAEDFFSILKAFGIKGIADVRRFPRSRKFPHFTREKIAEQSREQDLSYHWLGDLLGGFRKGGYENYKKEASYLEGLQKLEALAEESRFVLVCAERLPWKCHRLQISRSLVKRGWNVIHIIDRDRTWQPSGNFD